MDNTELVRNGIAELEKDLSLLQISKQSGISYLTLRKIKTGETKSVSSGVAAKFEKFKNSFVPGAVTKARPGRKPKAAATSATAAPAAPAKKKPGRPKKADAASAATAPAKKKPGRPKKAATPVKEAAASTAPVKKKATKKAAAKKAAPKKAAPKKKAGRPKKAAASAPTPAPAKRSDFSTPMLGEALYREIEIAQARLEYLKSLQMVEEEFLKAIGKK